MSDLAGQLKEILDRRVMILDGAMGTMIQAHKLDEKAFRGAQFAAHSRDLKGCNDVLCITQSDLITAIHAQYFEAGADIVETNTFNSTSISMADYKLEPYAYELNVAGAKAAKKAVEICQGEGSVPNLLCRRRHRSDQSDLLDLHRRAQRGDARA